MAVRRLLAVALVLQVAGACAGAACVDLDGYAGEKPDATPDQAAADASTDALLVEDRDAGADADIGELHLTLGVFHSCAFRVGGKAKCWGRNVEGELGVGDTSDRGDDPQEMGSKLATLALAGGVIAMAAGRFHTCALLDSGDVKCWGANKAGELGLDDAVPRNAPAGSVPLGRKAKAVGCGTSISCAILDDDSLKCWGENEFGQLGQNDTRDRGIAAGDMAALKAIPLGTAALVVGVGGDHVCAVLGGNNLVACWGKNLAGQLGLGDMLARGDNAGEVSASLATVPIAARATRLGLGDAHACITTNVNDVRCWGYGQWGQLGQGDTSNRGDDAGETPPTVALGTAGPRALAVGYYHECVIFTDNALKCWGNNQGGQLGLGNGNTLHRGDQPGEMGANLPSVDLGGGHTTKRVFAGGYHTCVVRDDDKVVCWGDNVHGQLGLGDKDPRGLEMNTTPDKLPPVDLGL